MVESAASTPIRILGFSAVILLGVVMLMQLLLAAGIMPVTMAWGGRHSELTTALRLSSLGAFLVLGGFAYVMARRTGIMGSGPPSLLIQVMSWLVSLYLLFNTVMNFLSPSPAEKWVFGPITLILTVLCLVISITKTSLIAGVD